MDKKLKMVNIVIWIMLAISLTILLIYKIATNNQGGWGFMNFNFGNGETSIQKEENIEIDQCENITLDFSSYDVVVSSTDDNKLKVVQKSSNNLKEDEKFSFSKNGNTIAIEGNNLRNKVSIVHFGTFNNKIELYVPKNYNKNLQVRTKSGNIEVKDVMNLDKINFCQNSGNFNSREIITANEVNLEASSGNIKAEALLTKLYKIKTSSGNIDIRTLSGSGAVDASSGNIKIGYKEVGDELRANASSGNVKLTLPKDISFEFYGQCTSGNIDTDFDVNYKNKKGNEATAKIGNEPYKKINVETRSGNIEINQN